MQCFDCGKARLIVEKKRHRYVECGLDNIVLEGVEISTCPACAVKNVTIPHMEALHALIAKLLVSKPEALNSAEIRYLRKSLGWSVEEVSQYLHVDVATAKRWENSKRTQSMSPQAELILRLAVAEEMSFKQYTVAAFQRFAFLRTKKTVPILFRRSAKNWLPDKAA